MNLKSKKGVTMLSLVIYVASFVVVAGIVGGITVFFYNNTNMISNEVYSAAEYNKFNMYLVEESEESGNFYEGFDTSSDMYELTFSNGDVYTLDTNNNLLYYNSICLCEDVQDLSVDVDYSTGKEVVKVKITFSDQAYTTSYTMNG